MMLRPVELNAAGNPWPGEADERWLDNQLMVDGVVAIRFVLQDVDAPADFRQHHGADKLVLDPYGLPFAIHRLFRNAIREGQRVHLPAAALIHALLQEHRILVRRSGQIRWNHQIFDAHLHGCFPLRMAIVAPCAASAHARRAA